MAEEAKTVGMDEDRPAPGGTWRGRGVRDGWRKNKAGCKECDVCVPSLAIIPFQALGYACV